MTIASPYKILFGPLGRGRMFERWLADGNIRTFNTSKVIHRARPVPSQGLNSDSFYDAETANFGDILAGLPSGWEPDVVIWNDVALQALPPGIEDCPFPTLAIVHDWPLNFQPVLDYLGAFDYVVSDRALMRILDRLGFTDAAFWPCYAHNPLHFQLLPGLERPYDVNFLGNIGYAHHRERNPWLERLTRLGDRYKILISDRYHNEDYLRLLNQTKICFNYEQRRVLNMRTYEAAACGALVMCESDNLEIRDFLVDGESCVYYDPKHPHEMEDKIHYYLAHDEERRRIARNGTAAMRRFDCEQQFGRLLELIPAVQTAFAKGRRQGFRQAPDLWKTLLRARQAFQCISPGAPERSLAILQNAPRPADPGQAAHLEAVRAALQINYRWEPGDLLAPRPPQPEALAALQLLEAAVAAMNGHPWQLWHAYNLACAQSMLHQAQKALPLWQQLIPQLSRVDVDLQALSWMLLLPRGHLHTRHELAQQFAHLWDKTSAAVMAGRESTEALRRLLLWQAFEFSGFGLIQIRQSEAAIQAFLQAEAVAPGSYFTYLPLLQLLLQAGRESELLECLRRAVSRLGLIESLQRDLIMTLAKQGRQAELRPVLDFYRLLMTCFQGGSNQARESIQSWIPGFLVWIPDLLEAQLDWTAA